MEPTYKRETVYGKITVLATGQEFLLVEPKQVEDNVQGVGLLRNSGYPIPRDLWTVVPVANTIQEPAHGRTVHSIPRILVLPADSYYVELGVPTQVWVWTDELVDPTLAEETEVLE